MKISLQLIGAAVAVAGCAWIFASGSRKKEAPARKQTTRPESPPTVESSSKIIYHGNVGSRVFHTPACKYYHCKTCSESFIRREDAVAAGYKPCTLCLP